jgi:hypothetical protein
VQCEFELFKRKAATLRLRPPSHRHPHSLLTLHSRNCSIGRQVASVRVRLSSVLPILGSPLFDSCQTQAHLRMFTSPSSVGKSSTTSTTPKSRAEIDLISVCERVDEEGAEGCSGASDNEEEGKAVASASSSFFKLDKTVATTGSNPSQTTSTCACAAIDPSGLAIVAHIMREIIQARPVLLSKRYDRSQGNVCGRNWRREARTACCLSSQAPAIIPLRRT